MAGQGEWSAVEFNLKRLLSERGLEPQYAKEHEPMPEQTVVRERFANRREFLVTFVAYVVSPVNIWRFPALIAKHGGAVFVWLYLAIVVVVGVPVSFLELALGQFSGKNPVRVWDLSPAFRGLGFSFLLASWLTSVRFQLTMSHTLLYAFALLGHNFPGDRCRTGWKDCFRKYWELHNWTQTRNLTLCQPGQPVSHNCLCHGAIHQGCRPLPQSSADFFYYEEILKTQQNTVPVAGFGVPSWEMALVLLCSWALVILLILRGIRNTTKFLYVTVLLPILGLIMVASKAAADPGAIQGLKFLFVGDGTQWDKLLGSQIWMDAVSQAFFSMNTVLGELFIVGGYLTFRYRYLRWDLILVTAVDVVTGLLAALIIFLTLGQCAYLAGPEFDLRDFLQPGSNYGLSFRILPVILRTFLLPHVWTTLFLILLYTLSIDSMFGIVETILTYVQDDFRIIRRNGVRARIVFGTVSYLADLILSCPGGKEMTEVIDEAAFSICLPLLALIEICVIMWGYGVRRFLLDLEYMLAVQLRAYHFLIFHYACFLPLSLALLFIGSFMDGFPALTLGNTAGKVGVMVFVLFPVPLWFCLYITKVFTSKHPQPGCGIGPKVMSTSGVWGPNDGSNIHRSTNTVFADLCDCLKAQTKPLPQEQDGFNMTTGPEHEAGKWEADHWFDSLFVEGSAVSTSGEKRRATSSRSVTAPLGQEVKADMSRRNTVT